MSNTIKYSTQTENNTLKKGDFVIGVNNVDYGPTSETGYHNTITPPEGGYVVYKNRGDNQRSIYVAQNDEELVTLKDDFGATGSTANDVLVWAAQQDDVLILNNPLDNIFTDGLVLYLDAGFTCSYPKSNTTWYDLSGNGNNGTLTNGPTFDSGNNGSIVFDGVDDRSSLVPYNSTFNIRIGITLSCFFKRNSIFTQLSDTHILSRPPAWYFYDEYNSGFIRGDVFIDGVRRGARSTPVPNDGKWYKIDYTYDSVSRFARIYKNGVLQSSTELTGLTNYLIDSSNANFLLIFGNSIGKSYFTSILSIYNRALTQQEVLQNYNAQKSRFGL